MLKNFALLKKKITSSFWVPYLFPTPLKEKTTKNDFSFSSLQKATSIQKAFFFGVSPAKVGLQVNHQKYQPFTINDCTFFFGDSLTAINNNKQLKKALWGALQKIFKQV